MAVTKAMVKEWRRHDPIAKHIFDRMEEAKEEWKDQLLTGQVNRVLQGKGNSADQNNILIGILFGIDLLLEMEFEDEPERNDAS